MKRGDFEVSANRSSIPEVGGRGLTRARELCLILSCHDRH